MMGTPDFPVWHIPWREQAACAGNDSEIWFTEKHLTLARQVCADCPVAYECLEDALRYPKTTDVIGVRAGLTPAERNQIRTHRRKDNAA